MIGFLRGKILITYPNEIVIDVQGVGYRVEVGEQIFLENEESELHIFTHVSERDIRLFGFKNSDDYKIFKMLLAVSGVGPKTAMGIVSKNGYSRIVSAINSSSAKELTGGGVGKKTAEKIILELKGKVSLFGNISQSTDQIPETNIYIDVIEALSSLGYRKVEIDDALSKVNKDKFDNSGDLIKEVLKRLRK